MRCAFPHDRRARKEVLVEEFVLLCGDGVAQRIAQDRVDWLRFTRRRRGLWRACGRHAGRLVVYLAGSWLEGCCLTDIWGS
jgi:hypothetical protein